ncbi:MAG: protein phosphatase 2C domain-containing protein [Eubacteriales bacterium]|nr:protein phosphatase 2C domain-containing protein [Eubacteriales bacterium]
MSRIKVCGMTQAGTSKRVNEDSFLLANKIYPDTLNAREQRINVSDDYWQVYSLTDGIGGPGVGDISSRLVQSYLIESASELPLLDPYSFDFVSYAQAFLGKADQALQQRLRRNPDPAGCSFAMLLFAGDSCYSLSIGNCRIYLYREQKLYRMTKDHVLPDDSDSRPLLFLGNHPGVHHLRAQNLRTMKIRPGDCFFLMSDGVTSALSDQDIQWVLDKPSPIQSYVESLFLNARRYDARDNQSILGLEVDSLRAFSRPDPQMDLATSATLTAPESQALTSEYHLSQLAEDTFQATLTSATQINLGLAGTQQINLGQLREQSTPRQNYAQPQDRRLRGNESQNSSGFIMGFLDQHSRPLILFLLVLLIILFILLLLK